MTDLKPCPFCGGAAEVVHLPGTMARVICIGDDCLIESVSVRDTPDEAIAAWNRRSPLPAWEGEVVERVARAICSAFPGAGDVAAHFSTAERANMWLPIARAALAALPAPPVSGEKDELHASEGVTAGASEQAES